MPGGSGRADHHSGIRGPFRLQPGSRSGPAGGVWRSGPELSSARKLAHDFSGDAMAKPADGAAVGGGDWRRAVADCPYLPVPKAHGESFVAFVRSEGRERGVIF